MVRPPLRVISGTDSGHIFDLQAKCRRGEPPPIPVSVALSPSALDNFIPICPQLQNPFRFTHGD